MPGDRWGSPRLPAARQPRRREPCHYPGTAAAFAAVTIRSCVSSGWETIAQCPLVTSIVSAPIRCANCLSASGGITSSFSATRNHEGSDFHAGGAHHVVKRGQGQMLLHGVHDLRLDRIDIGGEVTEEIVLGEPGETLRVDIDIRQCRVGGTPCSSAPIDSP